MTTIGWLQAIVFFLIVLALTKPLGLYMTRVFTGERTWLSPVLVPVERLIYRLCGGVVGDFFPGDNIKWRSEFEYNMKGSREKVANPDGSSGTALHDNVLVKGSREEAPEAWHNTLHRTVGRQQGFG